nr:hypothetical protein CFP56_68269 [Quercus suber]
MLLCISTLVVANIVEEEECELIDESERSLTNQRIEKQVLGKHGKESITSLQYWATEHTILFITTLLLPPIPADYSWSDGHLIIYAPF